MLARALLTTALLLTGCGDEPSPCAVPIGSAPVRGPGDALVTMVEFADFECPFCARTVATLDELVARYPSELRVAFKHFPLAMHEHAMAAALAAECAHAQGAFWPMYEALFANQSRLGDAALESYAAAVGVELESWRACLASEAAATRIGADAALGESAGVAGTPTFLVNGLPVVGAVPTDDLAAVIDDALATAQDSGVAASEYYASLSCR